MNAVPHAEPVGEGAKRRGHAAVRREERLADDKRVHARKLRQRLDKDVLSLPRGDAAEKSDERLVQEADLRSNPLP